MTLFPCHSELFAKDIQLAIAPDESDQVIASGLRADRPILRNSLGLGILQADLEIRQGLQRCFSAQLAVAPVPIMLLFKEPVRLAQGGGAKHILLTPNTLVPKLLKLFHYSVSPWLPHGNKHRLDSQRQAKAHKRAEGAWRVWTAAKGHFIIDLQIFGQSKTAPNLPNRRYGIAFSVGYCLDGAASRRDIDAIEHVKPAFVRAAMQEPRSDEIRLMHIVGATRLRSGISPPERDKVRLSGDTVPYAYASGHGGVVYD